MSVIVIGAANPSLPGVAIPGGSLAGFDNTTDTWTVTDPDGRPVTAAVVIDNRPSGDDTVAVHGLPNYFRIPGPDTVRQTRYVARCLDLLRRGGASRIEARSRVRLRRWRPQRLTGRFYLTGRPPGDEIFDGPAWLTLPDGDVEVRARLTGHLDAIDGKYHWRGTLTGDLPPDLLKSQRTAQLSVDGHAVSTRFVEHTPWGSYTVSGVGSPPFAPA